MDISYTPAVLRAQYERDQDKYDQAYAAWANEPDPDKARDLAQVKYELREKASRAWDNWHACDNAYRQNEGEG